MSKLIVFLVLLGFTQVFSQVESGYERYSLRAKGENVQEEKNGVFIFESDMNDYPSATGIIPFGGGRGVIHQDVENWTLDTIWIHSRRYKYEGTYPFNRLTWFGTYPSADEVVVFKDGIIELKEPPFYVPPYEVIYLWTGVRISETDKTTGSLVFKMPDKGYISLSTKQDSYQYLECNGDFPQNLTVSWVGAEKTWIDTTIASVDNSKNLNLDLSVYPNPFMEIANLSFKLEQAGQVRVSIVNIEGNEVITVADRYLASGEQNLSFNAKMLSAGTYFLLISQGDKPQSYRLIKEH